MNCTASVAPRRRCVNTLAQKTPPKRGVVHSCPSRTDCSVRLVSFYLALAYLTVPVTGIERANF